MNNNIESCLPDAVQNVPEQPEEVEIVGVRFKNAGGAVLTNCILASYAVGDVKDVKEALAANIARNAEYHPDPVLTKRYRTLFVMRNTLVRHDMKEAFSRLTKMRDVD